MLKKVWMTILILFVIFGFSGIAVADLITIGTATYNGRDYNLIYENDQGLIWLDYTMRNPGGWENSVKWVAGLNASGVLTYKFNPGITVTWESDWRLPKTVDGRRTWGYDGKTTAGFNITTSEMGHLFYVSLENLGHYDIDGKQRAGWGDDADWGLKNKGPFTNLISGIYDSYWSGTEYSIYYQHAWAFSFTFGSQSNGAWKTDQGYSAIAVRPGKVVSAPVR